MRDVGQQEAEGKLRTKRIPPAPLIYILYRWRKQWGASWHEAINTPMSVIKQDFEIAELIQQYGEPAPQPDEEQTAWQ